MAYFRIVPGTEITVTPSKSQYEVGEDIDVNVGYTVEAKELAWGGQAWEAYCDVHIFGTTIKSGGVNLWSGIGGTDVATVTIPVYLGKATTAGVFDGYVVPKAKGGIL